MPGYDWQLTATVMIVSLAAGYVAISVYRSLRGRSSCGSSCGGCRGKSSQQTDEGLQLVSLQSPTDDEPDRIPVAGN